MCIWIAETEEDARQLAEAAKEAEAAAANDDNVKADLSKGVMIVQKRSRDHIDRARREHIANVGKMHSELSPLFHKLSLIHI